VFEISIALVLGLVQGITEFLPISSTAHLYLTSVLFRKSDIGISISNVIQFGTFLSILIYFKNDIVIYISRLKNVIFNVQLRKEFLVNCLNWLKEKRIDNLNFKTDSEIMGIAVATLPIIITALLFRSLIEKSDIVRNPTSISIFLILGGILILSAETYYNFVNKKIDNKNDIVSLRQSIIVGIFQSLAIFPGISRSGACISGSLFAGGKRENAVKFAFLLSIPALGLASIYDIIKWLESEVATNKIPIFPSSESNYKQISVFSVLLSTFFAFIVGYVVLNWLLSYLKRHDAKLFVIYRVILSLAILYFLS
jgi:undecaprenyl-diphosphatase